ncbi:TLC domain-containing protein At5g14285 [Ipomoea triloba]|uniref:TLC domain-containing protein At5g14285 n=1 Tax=Ipomoea triloba TaxID=35885 RepID=UPI00125D6F8A|nr:TLC domain-containing protein At5g14285 [Ipomoea triloba]
MMEALSLITSIPNLPLFFAAFLLVYLIAYFIIFRNWKPMLRPEAASCAISFSHGTPAVFLAAAAILSDPDRSFHSRNTPFQGLVLDFSVAYFLMDLCHYLIFYPSDLLFIGHHLATLFVFLTCRYVVCHGAYAILVLLVLAEVTSFCQNTWTLAAARKSDSQFAAKLYEFLSPPFYALYSVVRGFAGPLFMYQMFVSFLSGAADTVIPRWMWISWIVVILTAISVSILWVFNLWVDLYRQKTLKSGDKKSR